MKNKTFSLQWEIEDAGLVRKTYKAIRKVAPGVNLADDLTEQAANVILFMDYWQKALKRMSAIQFCDVGLTFCGIKH